MAGPASHVAVVNMTEPEDYEMTDREWDELERRNNTPAFTKIDYEKDRLRYNLECNNWLNHIARGE